MISWGDQSVEDHKASHRTKLSDDGYFNALPREIILFILSHLDFRSLIQCCQVSKNFRTIASDPLLYKKLKLKPLFHLVSNATLKSVFRKTKLLKYLDLSHCGNYGLLTPVTLRTFIYARGSGLTNLLLQNCHAVTSMVLMAIGTCKQLVDLDLSNLHFIETGNFAPITLLQHLQQLNLYRTRIGTPELSEIIKSNASSLRALYLGSCLRIDADKICEILSNGSCDKLEILDLWRSASLTSRGVTHLSNLSILTDLDLGKFEKYHPKYLTLYSPFWTGWCVNVLSSTGVIKSLVSSNKQLRRLILTAHRQTSDSDIEAIYLLGGTLEQFSCMGSRNVSPEAILDLAMHCPNLQYLDVSYCDQLETAHVIHDRLRTLLPNCNVQISINDV